MRRCCGLLCQILVGHTSFHLWRHLKHLNNLITPSPPSAGGKRQSGLLGLSVGDDNDGHFVNFARFFKADGTLNAKAHGIEHSNYCTLAENTRRLQDFRTPQGEPFALVKLPLPNPITHKGKLLAASYLNFIVLNGAVLVPNFGQSKNDATVLEIISDCFPDREIVAVDWSDIIKEGGALHYMSQHQPAVS